jgi:hypothetical protein
VIFRPLLRKILRDMHEVQRLAIDSNIPAKLQSLGVLQRLMIGDRNVDLSSLPREWAELVSKILNSEL